MNRPLLSILIPTVVGRESKLDTLVGEIKRQCGGAFKEVKTYDEKIEYHYLQSISGPVMVVIGKDDKRMPVGEKRGLLYDKADGLYCFMPDDDDGIAPDFIDRILKGIKENHDCITYYEHVDIDGDISKSNHSIKYSGWHDNPTWPEGFKYARTPYFKDVIKTEIAKSVQVPAIRWNEDEQWANVLHPLLKNEYHIDDFMYFYKHVSSNPTERYGLDK